MDDINKEIIKEDIGPKIGCSKEPIGCLLWMDDVALISKCSIQQYLPSADPLIGGHLLWADTFLVHELHSNLNQPLMNGHLLNADRDTP